MQANTTQPSTPPLPTRAGAARALQLWEILLFVSVATLFSLVGITVLRMLKRRRSRIAKETGADRRPQPTQLSNVWEESAARMKLETGDDIIREVVPTDDPVVPHRGDEDDPNAKTRAGMAMPRDGRRPVVLVTGGARRVGRAIAEAFAGAGCDVIITYLSSDAESEETVAALRKRGVSAGAFRVDLGELDELDRWAQKLADHLPRLDVVVHNASIYEPSPIDEGVVVEAMRHYRINALAPLLLTSRLAPLLSRSTMEGGGAVVCMSDIHALGRPRRGYTAYSMSKAALTEMVQSLARELAPSVRVNAVAPGVVAWPEAGFESEPAEQRGYVRRIPLGRAGTPEDAARAVRWLALEATYVTGEVVRVDGGRWLT
ncbi:MAG: SDR family oxidoreductase [Phycisphaerales bacterium]